MCSDRLGHYELLAEIGHGGMGRVYRARDTRLGREVAIKLLHPELACDADCRTRFEREARSVAALKHPNIVTIHAVEQDGDRYYLAMELVEGASLRDLIPPKGMPLTELLDLILPVCDALAAAHAKGIVHCDLKPGNIMVDERSQVKVLDFGLARSVAPLSAAEAGDDTVTLAETLSTGGSAAGAPAGTPAYMSPEQLSAAPLGPASDVFSLGVLLFEMVTGERPFEGPTALRVAAAILSDEPPPLAERGKAAAALAPIIQRCLRKVPADRYPDAMELGTALAQLQGDADPPRLVEARAAFDGHDWRRTYELLSEVEGTNGLSAADLERFGETAFWIGEEDEMVRLFERAFAEHMNDGNHARAGFAAVFLAETSHHRLASAVARGWLKRAERILGDLPETKEYGYLLRFQTVLAIETMGEFDRAIELADRVLYLAREHGDRDLEALAMQDRGRALIAQGHVVEGMTLLDEVMASAVSGELSPLVVGKSYCNMISSCHALADYRRAGEWSTSGIEWCQAHSESAFPGLCRVYRAEVIRLRGAWAEAEAEARQICNSMSDCEITGAAFYEIGEIRLRLGDEEGTEAAFRQAHQLGQSPMPGLAALRLAQGRTDAARELLQRSLADPSLPTLDRVRILPVQVEAAVADGDLAAARSAVDELESAVPPYESMVFAASCEQAQGVLALAEGDLEAACSTLERSLRLWTQADLPYESARARALLAGAYQRSGNREAAGLEADAARAVFRRLGAMPDLRAAEALPGGDEAAAS